MKRQVSYQWRLRERMAAAGMFPTTELVAPLRERGIDLSVSQVHRLATGTLERLSLPVLAALCDIFDCTPAELISTRAENVAVRKTATGDDPRRPVRGPAHAGAPAPRLTVDRSYATAEQYDRWFMADCVRCGRHRHKAVSWPDGPVCRTCADRAVRTRGLCPGCRQDRALPGRRGDGTAVCATCAGFSRPIACSRCGFEDKLHAGRLCTRCTFTDRLTELLDDGTGQVRPALVPLRDALLAMDNPLSGLTWLYPRKDHAGSPGELLRRLGRGEIELTHEAFHTLQPWRAAAHLRELLMACGALPAIDKQLCSFERWLTTYLPDIDHPDHARVLRQYATWQVLPWLRRRAAGRSLGPNTRRHAGAQVRRAEEFLQWLSGHDRTLRSCGQADLDRWHVEHRGHERQALKPFLQRAMRTQRMPRLLIPRHQIRQRSPISQQQRLTLIRRVLTDDTIALRTRVAAGLTLLYAQPLTRIVRLTTSDIVLEDDQVLLRLGSPPTPVPAPLDGLLLQLRDHRTNMRTATPDSPWLFPGRRAGQPLRPEALGQALRALDLPSTPGRTAALRQLVLQAPAPGRRRHARLPPRHARLPPEAHRPGRRRRRQHLEPLRPRK